MKKILLLGIIILSVFIIYLTTLDKKVYYVSLGDQIALGITKEGYYEKNYTDYIKEYLEKNKILETCINEYQTQGYRITDIINDINNNKEIEETGKTIKNSLIKADLLTISIGTNDITSKIDETKKLTKIDYNKIKKNIDTIIKDLDNLLKLIREYCKEDIIMIGININTYENLLKNKIYPTKEEYQKIGEEIIKEMNLLKK